MDKYLYHGSPIADISLFKPSPSEVVNNEFVVFAGDLWVGIASVCRWQDSDIIQGIHHDKPYIQEVYPDAFKRIYKNGGYLYKLPKSTFKMDKRICPYEYISKKVVIPISSKYIADPISELIKLKVDIIYCLRNPIATDW